MSLYFLFDVFLNELTSCYWIQYSMRGSCLVSWFKHFVSTEIVSLDPNGCFFASLIIPTSLRESTISLFVDCFNILPEFRLLIFSGYPRWCAEDWTSLFWHMCSKYSLSNFFSSHIQVTQPPACIQVCNHNVPERICHEIGCSAWWQTLLSSYGEHSTPCSNLPPPESWKEQLPAST